MKPDSSSSATKELSMNCSGFAVLPAGLTEKFNKVCMPRRRHVGRLFPRFDVGVVSFVQVFFVVGFSPFADDLFGELGIGASDLVSFDVGLHVTAHFVALAFDKITRGR